MRKAISLTPLVSFLLLMGSAGEAGAQADPAGVATALISAENAKNVEAAVALFHPDAVVNDVRGQLRGTDQVRQWQTDLATGNFRATIGTPQVAGEQVTFGGTVALNLLRNLGLESLDATWELIVQAGGIRTFTFAFTPDAAARLQKAQARALPGTGPLGTGTLLAVAAGAVATGLVAVGLSRVPARRRPRPA